MQKREAASDDEREELVVDEEPEEFSDCEHTCRMCGLFAQPPAPRLTMRCLPVCS